MELIIFFFTNPAYYVAKETLKQQPLTGWANKHLPSLPYSSLPHSYVREKGGHVT
jgi:hypothetical protein